MNILYIDHYAGSTVHGMEFRPFYMAQEWQRLGHKVTVVAASFSHLRQQNPCVQGEWTEETVHDVDFVWLRCPPYVGNGLGRVRNMLCFVYLLYRYSRRLLARTQPDVVICSSTYPFDIFPGRKIARSARARLIFELHDLWPLSPMELGKMSRFHPFIIFTQFSEDYVCRRADVIVSMLPKADEHLKSRGMRPEKFVYVPNGVVLNEWRSDAGTDLPDLHKSVIAEHRSRGNFVVLYAGAHGLLNNLALVVDAARLIRQERISIIFVGQGPEKPALQERAAGLENVHFLPPVPKATVPKLLTAADALLLSFAPQPLFRFGVSPNKLMDYMMAARPIVAAMRAGNNLVEEHGCGITAEPDDPESLAGALRQLARLDPEVRALMGANARSAVEQNYSYAVLAKRFERCFQGEQSRYQHLLEAG